MITPEEAKVLTYLRQRFCSTVRDVARSCLAGASAEWVDRVVANLDWFGYVTVYYGPGGEPSALQITDKGMAHRGV